MKNWLAVSLVVLCSLVWTYNTPGQTAGPRVVEKHVLRGHTTAASTLGRVPATNSLRLAISLPLRNREALSSLLQRLYDPSSPDYRHYLTPAQFNEKFGPTEEDYQKVIHFAQTNGLSVESTHESRMLVDVRGKVSDIEKAFHVGLQTYQHPREARRFHAPDAEPWVEANLPILNVTGLNDYALIRRVQAMKRAGTKSGSAGGNVTGGPYDGEEFRKAYVPGVSLQGTGQMVGLFEADGYYTSDIINYEGNVLSSGLPFVPLQNVLIDSFSGNPGSGNGEVALDIEMAISMAPGLSGVVVFECTNSVGENLASGTEVQYWLDTLDTMASSNYFSIKQFSSSWGYIGGTNTDPNPSFDLDFEKMAAQGQSFFQASGDGDAWITPIWVPADSTNVISVGGTSLTMSSVISGGPGTAYSSEKVWNSSTNYEDILGDWFAGGNGYWGSGGGVSTIYPIPSWQKGMNMTANQGSTTMRNIPDVALAADNIVAYFDNGSNGIFIGTSCSAPLWAGIAALVNQQAANSNMPPAGFLNPAIYALGRGPNYNLCFHDTTSGNNASGGSPSHFSAVPGYDLCTGWGTPNGSNLINALAGIYQPSITTEPASQTNNPQSNVALNVLASGAAPLSYQWQFDGTNLNGDILPTLLVSNLSQANAGNYTVVITNQWGSLTSSVAVLTLGQTPEKVTWNTPANITYGTALGSSQLDASANVAGSFAYTPAIGSVLSAGTHALTAVFTPTDTVDYTKATNTVNLVVTPAALSITATAQSKSYGTALSLGTSAFTTSGLQNSDSVGAVTLTASGSPAGSAATAPVGSYSITPSAATGGTFAAANYTITYHNGTLTVSPTALSITANTQSKTYGTALSLGTSAFTTGGLKNSDSVGAVTLTASGSPAGSAAAAAAGSYTITPSAATGGTFAAGNYTISYHTGTLTVSPATLSITATAQSKTYGTALSLGTSAFTTSGLKNSDTVGSVILTASGSPAGSAAAAAAGSYTITPSAATGGTFAAGNYTITYNTGTLTVNPAALSITASAQSKTYGTALSLGTSAFTTSGLLNSDSVSSVTLTASGSPAGSTAAAAAGSYTITPSAASGGTFAAANYTITYLTGALTVNPAALSITANAQSKTYGSALSLGTSAFTTSGLKNSDSVGSVTLVASGSPAGSAATAAAGSYTITPSAASGGTFASGNYTITYHAGTLTVNPASLNITADAQSKTYGTALNLGTSAFVVSGLLNSDSVSSVTLTASGSPAGSAANAPVGGYTITPSAAAGATFAAGNYNITYNTGALTVNPAALSITASAQNKAYGTALSLGTSAFATSGLQNSESIGSVSLIASGSPVGTAANAPVGSYTITPSAASGGTFVTGNYNITYNTGTLTVNPTALSIMANAQSKTYGAGLSLGTSAFTTSGLKNSDTVGSVTLTASGSPAGSTAAAAAGNYTITPSAASGGTFVAGNYTITYNTGTLTVNPAALSITANAQSKTYGTALSLGTSAFVVNGLQNSDAVSSVILSANGSPVGSAATAPVGSYTITPSAASGAAFSAGNYTITYNTGVLTVSPAALNITANAQSKTYGASLTLVSSAFTASGLQNSDAVASVTLTASGSPAGSAATAPVGSYTITPSAASGAAFSAGNYTITYNIGALTVNPAALSITANAQSKTYGTALSLGTSAFVSSGLKNSDAVGSVTLTASGSPAGSAATAPTGSYTITPSAAAGGTFVAGNYTITYNTGTLTVNPAALSITANAQSKTYGAMLSLGTSAFVSSGLQNSDAVTAVTLTASGSPAGSAATAPVGSYTITPSAASGATFTAGNYTITYNTSALTVNPTGLSITASAQSKTYGTALSLGTSAFVASGLQNGDVVTTVTLTASGSPAGSAAAAPVGSYTITPSAASGASFTAGNYTITYNTSTLTVNPTALSITPSAQSKIYGTALSLGTSAFVASGLQNGDAVTAVTLTASGSPAGSVATAPVGSYTITPSAASGAAFSAGNYTITYNTAALTVNPAPLSITASAQSKTYGGTLSLGTSAFVTSGLQNSESVGSVTLTAGGSPAGSAASAPVGSYTITPSGAAGGTFIAGNYTITYHNGTLTVIPAALSITANAQSKTYGTTLNLGTSAFVTAGLLNSDGVSGVTLNSAGAGAAATVAGGPYSIVPSGALGTGLGNYAISYVNGSLAVNPAGLTVTASGRGKVYGQTVTFVGTEFSTAGLVNGDTVASVTLTSAGAAASATVAGSSYNIVPSAALGTGLANYTVNYVNGALTVSPAGLTVTANSRGKVYGQTVTFAGTEFSTSGLVNSDAVASVTLTSAGAAGSATVAGSSYSIVPSAALGAGLANYTIAYVNGSLAVSPANLTVTANNRTKIYGQTVTFAGTEFVPSGLLNSDAVASVTLTSAGAAASATVAGSSYSIVPSAALGTGLANYTIAYVNGLLAVNRAGLTITANNRAKTYGQTVTFAGTEFVAAGLVNSDAVASVTLTSAGAAASATVAGSPYPIVPSAALGTGLANYAIAYVNGTLTVGEMALTITWPAPAPIIYGAALGAAQLNATASVAGSFVYNPTNGAVLDSGSQTLSVIFTPADTVDYSPMSQSVGLTVSPAPLTVTAANTNRVYGQANPLLTGTIAGVTNGDLITAVYGSSAVPNSPLGPYAIVPSLVDPDNSQTNYTVHLINGVLTVAQAAPALLWTNPAPIVYGAALGAAQLNATASVPGGFAYNLPSGTVLTAGAHQLSVVFTPADTVDYSPVNGTVSLVVLPAPLTVTAASFSRPFGTANPVFTGTITGLANGDNITANYNCSANSASPVGTYPIVPSLLDPDNRQTNYTVNLADGILVVGHPAEAFAWGAPAPIIYGTALSPAQLNAVANVPGVYTYTPASGTVLPSGTYTLAVQFTPTDTVDYTNVTQSVSLVVSPAPLTVAAAATNRAYGQVNPVLTGTITGAAHGDVISAAYHCSATAGSAAGPYPITAGPAVGGGLTNYTIAYVNGTLTVNPASLTVTANNRAKNYGQAATFVGTEFGSSGLVNGDTVTGVTLASAGAAAAAGVAGSPYSIMPSAAVGTGLVNYTITYVNGALTVAPAPLTITANNRSKSYGQTAALAGTGFGSSGLVNGDTVTGVTLASAGAAAGATLAGSPYTIVASAAAGTGLGNYTITYVNGALTVAPAPLTITANSGSKSYGQALLFAGTEITSSGLVNGDTVASATLTSTGAAATATVAGSPYGITVGGAAGTGLVNYTITYANGPLIVTPASLTVTANSRSKIYGQAVTFAGTEITSSGLVNGNTVTSATLASAGAAVTAAVAGSPYNITPSAALGTGLVNYTITYVNGPLTVTPASLTVTAGSRSKIYGQAVTFAGTEITSSGLLNGDTLTSATLTSAGAAVTAAVAGSPYNITPSAALGTGLVNYTIIYASGALTVTPASLTVTASGQSKTYGQALTFAGTEITSSGLLNGDTVTSANLNSAGAAAAAAVAGSPYSIVPSAAAGAGLNNYTIAYANGTLAVNPAALAITANNRAKTYGQAVTFAGTEFASGGLVNGDTVTSVTLTSTGAAAAAAAAGSPYKIVPSAAVGTGLNNYTITYANGSLALTPAALTITANNRSKIYGQTVTFAGTEITTSGLLNGDLVNSATLSSAGAAAVAAVAASPYSIVPSAAVGAGLANYTITYASGALAITPASLTITANNRAKTYGQSTSFAGTEITTSGLLNNDTVSGATLNSAGAAATATVAGSPYPIIPSAALGTGLANYALTYGNGTLTIAPAPLAITANNRSKTYGQTITFAGTEFAAAGLVNNDTVSSATLHSSGAAATAAVAGSPYTIVPSAAVGTGLANYAITYGNGTLTLAPAPLTITANNRSKTYGQAITFAGTEFAAAGLVNNDTVSSATLTSPGAAAAATVAGSPYPIVPSAALGTGLPNYTLSYVNGTLSVSDAGPTIVWANPSPITYGTPLSFAQLNATADVAGSFAYTPTNGTVLNSGVNTLSVRFTPADTADYNSVSETVSLVVLPGPLTVTATSFSRAVGAVNPVLTGSITGLVNGDNITAIYSCSAVPSSPTGTYPIVPSLVDPNDRQTNYAVSLVQGILVVGHPSELFGWAEPASIVYGTALSSMQLNAAANIPGSYAYEPTNGSVLNTGTNTLSVIFTPDDTGNYDRVTRSVSLVVSPAPLSVIAANANRTYGQANPVLAGAIIGVTNGDVISATYSCGATPASPVGVYTMVPGTAVGSDLTNYTITYVDGTMTVEPAPLTIAADNRAKIYGQTLTFTGTEFSSVGLANGDTVASVTLVSPGSAGPATVAGSPYNIVPSAAVGTGLGNYTITYGDGTMIVDPAILTLTANNHIKTYGQTVTFAGTEFSSTGLANGDVVTGVSLTSAGAEATSTTAGSPYSIVPSAAAGVGLANYTLAYVNGLLTVNRAALTITANNGSKSYGQTETFAGTEFAANGLVNGNTVTSVNLASAGAAGTATVAGSPYAIVPSAAVGTGLGSYTVSYVNGTLTVSTGTPIITWANPGPITYGTALNGVELNATANVPGKFVYNPGKGTVLNSGVNTLSVTFTPSDGADYNSVNGRVSLIVLPAPLTVTADSFSRPVRAANPVFTGTIAGLVNGDDITATYSCRATVDSPVGTYPIVPRLTDPNDRQTNYTLNLVRGILVVGHPDEVLAWDEPAPIVYGTALSSVQLNAAGNIPGSYVYDPTNGAVLNTGTNTLSVLFTPANASSYSNVVRSVSLMVLPAPLSVIAANTNRAYGQPNPLFAGRIVGVTNGDIISAAYSCSAATTSPVGHYAIVPGAAVGTDLTNYTITYVDGTMAIDQAALILRANNRIKLYGQTVAFAGTEFSSTGLVNGDAVTGITLGSAGMAATATVTDSPYDIVASGAVGIGLANYAITYADGIMTVDPARLSVRANNRAKTYGQTVTFAGKGFSSSGLVNGDTVVSVTLASSGSAAGATVAGSPYDIVPSAAVGTGLINYTISYADGLLTVNPAALTIMANNQSKTYGQTITFAGTEFTAGGLVNGNSVTVVTLTSSGAAATAMVGGSPYAIVPSAAMGAGLANYAIAYVNGTLTVGQAAPIMSWTDPAPITYGTALNGVQLNASANVPGSFVYNPTSGTVLNSGINTLSVVFTPTDAVDYSSGSATASLTVLPAPLTVTAASFSRQVGAANPVFTGTITGLLNGDNIAATYSSKATTSSPVGTYAIVPHLVDANNRQTNYAVTLKNGILVVGHPDEVFAWAEPAPITYGTALSSMQLNAAANIPGSYIYAPTNGTVLNTGVNTLSVLFTPANVVNYESVIQSVNLVVAPAPLAVTANNAARSYGVANPLLTGSLIGVTNGDSITAIYASSATSTSPVGTYAIMPTLADPGNRQTNYTVSVASGTLTVGQGTPMLVWTNPAPIIYGTVLNSLQLNATANVPGSFSYSQTNGATLNTGTNGLSVLFTPADAVDYGTVSATVSLVVLPAPLTVTAASFSRPFNAANPVFTGAITGLAKGDDITAAYSCSASASSLVGTYPIVPALVDPSDRHTNYSVTLVNGILVVGHPAELLGWAEPYPIIYGTALTAVQLSAAANIPGSYAYNPREGTVLNTGTNPLSVIFTPTDLVNYKRLTRSVSQIVYPAPLMVSAANTNRGYGQANPVLTGTILGAVNGDKITASYSTTATPKSPLGAYPIIASLAGARVEETNYSVTFVNGTLTVNQAAPLITWAGPAPIGYGSALTANQLNATANVGGTFVYSPPLGTVPDAGSDLLSVVFNPANSTLYTSSTDTVSMVVLPAPLSVVANNSTRSYGQSNAVFTGTLTGVVNGDNITASYGSSATLSSPPGTYAIVPSLMDANDRLVNYAVTSSDGVLEIDPITNAWNNPKGGTWSHSTNWLSGKVPGPYDTVIINGQGNFQVILDTNAIVGNLLLGGKSGSQTLLITSDGLLTLSILGMTISSQGTLINQGHLVVDANVTGEGSITNYGSLLVQRGIIYTLGNMFLGGSSILTLPVNDPKKFEPITVGGFFQMGGTFNLNFAESFIPGPSQVFRLLNWHGHTGGFSSAIGQNLGNGFYLQGAADYSGLTFWTESLQGYPAIPQTSLVNQTVAAGGNAAFFIEPEGKAPFVFQWSYEGSPVFRETNTASTLAISGASAAKAGTYCVETVDAASVTNVYCATLSVLDAPAIVTEPAMVTITNGGSADLSAVVTGDDLQYEWWLNGELLNGATNPTYTITGAQPQDGGTYTEAIFNAVGAVTSTPVVVVYSAPALPFADNFANRGTIAGLSGAGVGQNGTATRETGEPYIGGRFGDHSVWLQWTTATTGLAMFDTKGSSFDTLLGVYTGASLSSLTAVADDDDGGGYLTSQVQFYAQAGTTYAIAVDGRGTNGAGNIVLSWSLTTNSQALPIITQQPLNTGVPLNAAASLTVSAISTATPATLRYQWYNGGWLAVPGATNATLTFPDVTPEDVGYYSVEVTDANGQVVDSRQAALDIEAGGYHSYEKLQDLLDALAGLPTNLRKLDGGSAFQSVSVGTLGQLTVNNGNGKSSQNSCFDICNNAIYVGLTPTTNGIFIVDDSCSSACSTFSDVVLDVYQYVSGSYTPVVCATYDAALGGAKATFAGTAGVDYVVEIDGGKNMGGTVQVNYQFGVPPLSDIATPQKLTQKELSSFVLSSQIANLAQSTPSYQWYLNGHAIDGATGINYTNNSAQFADAGTYSFAATNAFGSTGQVPVAEVTVPGYLPAPTLTTPTNGGSSTPVTVFSWSQVNGATGYLLAVATMSGDLPPAPESVSGGTSIVVNTNVIGNTGASARMSLNTTYYWEVQASNATQWGTWSDIYSFSNTVPPPDFTNYSFKNGLIHVTVARLTPEAILVVSNSTDLRSWSFLTNSTNIGTNLILDLDTNLLPPPQFLKASEH